MDAPEAARQPAFFRSLPLVALHPGLREEPTMAHAIRQARTVADYIAELVVRQADAIRPEKFLAAEEDDFRDSGRALLEPAWLIADVEGLGPSDRAVFHHPGKNTSTAEVCLALRNAAELIDPTGASSPTWSGVSVHHDDSCGPPLDVWSSRRVPGPLAREALPPPTFRPIISVLPGPCDREQNVGDAPHIFLFSTISSTRREGRAGSCCAVGA